MNVTTAELLIAALATWQTVEVWRHSELAATARATAELVDGFFGRLLRCMFCLSVWTGTAIAAAVLVPYPEESVRECLTGAVCALMIAGAVGAPFAAKAALRALWVRNPAGRVLVVALVFGWAAVYLFPVVVVVGVLPPGRELTVLGCGAWFVAATLVKLLVFGLAVSRLANLGNDLFYGWCRTPRSGPVPVSQEWVETNAGDEGKAV